MFSIFFSISTLQIAIYFCLSESTFTSLLHMRYTDTSLFFSLIPDSFTSKQFLFLHKHFLRHLNSTPSIFCATLPKATYIWTGSLVPDFVQRRRKTWGQGQSGQTIELFQAPPKINFTFHFSHKSFILDDVKPAELSDNSFEWKNVTFYTVILRPRGQTGLEVKMLASASALSIWPRATASPRSC